MGKGNRNRQDKAQDSFNNPGKKIKNKGKKNWLGIGVIGAVAALLVVVLVVTAITSTGFLLRSKNGAKSDNYKVDGAMMSYFFNSDYQTWLNTYGSYVSQGASTGLISLNPALSLKQQQFGKEGYYDAMFLGSFEGTWFDYFMTSTIEKVKTYLAYCEGAKEAGISLGDEEYGIIDDTIDSYKDTAKANSLSLNELLARYYGKGVKEKDVRNALEIVQLAAKFWQTNSDRIGETVTDDDILKYFENNLDEFVTASYLAYEFSDTIKTIDVEDYDGEDDPDYIAAVQAENDKKAALDNAAAELAALENEEEFKNFVIEKVFGDNFNSSYDTLKSKLKEEDVPNEEEKIELRDALLLEIIDDIANETEEEATETEAEEPATITLDEFKAKLKKELREKAEDEVNKLANKNYSFNIDAELGQWIFGGVYEQYGIDPATLEKDTEAEETTGDAESEEVVLSGVNPGVGDTKIITSTASDGSYTVTVYMVTEEAGRKDGITKNCGHILFTEDVYGEVEEDAGEDAENAKTKAEEILAEFLAGEKTKEAFETLGKEYTADSGVFLDNVYEGQTDSGFDSWLFDEEREAGDTGIVKTVYGYHIIYFLGDSDMTEWEVKAKTGSHNEKNEEYFESVIDKYEITINENIGDAIDA